MVRLMTGLAVALLRTAPVWAGELDGDFVGAPAKAHKVQEKAIAAPLPSLAQQTDAKAAVATSSELDEESPAQAYRRGGWGGGGWGRGWGGWGGWGRGWGGGWGRGWYGYRGWGWGRGWGGWGGGWPYYASAWRWGWGWPYYASLWRPYVGYYGYGSAYYDPYSYCW